MEANKEPTRRQIAALKAIHRHLTQNGFPPTLRELADAMRFASATAAWQHVRLLSKKGLLEQVKGSARTMRITQDGMRWIGGAR